MKNFYLCRALSVATFVGTFLLLLTLTPGLSSTSILYSIGCATTILILSSRKGGHSKSLVPISVFSAILSLLLAVVSVKVRNSIPYALGVYSLAVALPVIGHMLVDVSHATNDVDFLCERIQGWELAVSMVEYTHTTIFLLLSLMSYAISLFMDKPWGAKGIILCVVNALMLGYSTLRHFVVSGTDQDISLRQRMKRKIKYLLNPNASQEITINYKMLFARMTEFMDRKKPYLNPNFCLDEMSRCMFTNSGYISRVINSCTGGNFSQFVNGYRVRYAMELFEKDNSLKVHELSQLSGFSTKVTFNMAFKLVMNETPGEWCRHYLENTPQGKALSNLKGQQK